MVRLFFARVLRFFLSQQEQVVKTKEADGADEQMLPAGGGDVVRAPDVKFTAAEEKERLNGDAKIDIGTWGGGWRNGG